ncbi:hypothetical protein GCM10010172_31610 [Paractinoplanes ferrugineus]|uniref:Uncharacterized protein n=1 Tax=Paractinoplanes ferrugineus TaxID=113564 RepID=A0A919MND1_9ACTN|nr:hypothetical protein [Actinoplanes ferrugineus]GIE14147.1 hypothetical protein Afe05nite_59870 [Actinoplanes ferrugineus]
MANREDSGMVQKRRGGRRHHRARQQIRWSVIDAALAPFTAASVRAVLAAAMDAPGGAPWAAHLAPLWLRSLRRPPRGDVVAAAEHVDELAAAAVHAASERPVIASRSPNDPRLGVGFSVGARRWRIHPGDHEHPTMTLRRMAAAARAVDEDALHIFGFSFTDAIEVILAHGHRSMMALAASWPEPEQEPGPVPVISAAQIEVAAEVQAMTPAELTQLCSNPQRAAAALAWLTCGAHDVEMSAFTPALGAVLFVRSAKTAVGVPASLTLDALVAAGEAILRRVGGQALARRRIQALTLAHATRLYSKTVVDRFAELPELEAPFVAGPRTLITVTSALTPRTLSAALDQAADRLREYADGRRDATRADAVKVVVFGGPLALAFQAVTDVVLVHVDELVEILADTGGDWIAVEHFLEDLGRHHGFERVEFLDLLDVWAAWRRYGRLGPVPDEQGAVLRVAPDDEDFTWDNAAAWDPVDAVLTAARMPPHHDWPVGRLVPGVGADLFTRADADMAIVGLDPPVVIQLDASEGQAFGVDPDTMVGLADGIRHSLSGHPDTAGHTRLAGGAPLRIVLRLIGDGPSGSENDPWVRVAVAPEHAVVEVGFGVGVLEQFLGDGMTGHHTVGAALHEIIRQVRAERDESPGPSAEVFLRGWQTTGPITTFITRVESLPRMAPVDTLPRTEAVRARALHRVFDLIHHQSIAGTFMGEEAHALCQQQLIPAIEQQLSDQLTSAEPGLLRQLAVRLNAVHASHFRRTRQVADALTRPWAANWHHLARDNEAMMNVRAAETLFEFALAQPPCGERRADAMAAAELTALTEFLLTVTNLDYGYELELHDLRIDVLADGTFAVEATDPEGDRQLPGVDVEAYHQALRDEEIAAAARTPAPAPSGMSDENGRSPFRDTGRMPVDYRPTRDDLPSSLRTVDDHLAAGMDAVHAVLGVAVDWPADEDGIAVISVTELIAEAISWSGLAEEQIRAALGTLTLSPDVLPALRERKYLEVERREHRIPLRPLPVISQQVWIMPWVALATQRLHAAYFSSSRLPYPDASIAPQATQAMGIHRKASNIALEHKVREIVESLGLPHRFQFTQNQLAEAGIANPVGEIDLLIADPATRRLWVCEVKDPIAAFSPVTLRVHVGKFLRPRQGHVAKLLKKAEQLRQYPSAAAAACGVDGGGAWRVVPLMVTRRVEPAAYATAPQVAFALPHQLATTLTDTGEPAPGPRG